MKSVVLAEQTNIIPGKTFFPGEAVVSDAESEILDTAVLVVGDPVEYRAPNVNDNMTFRGAWDADETYVVSDVVTDGDESFVCLLANDGELTSDTDYWAPLGFTVVPTTNVAVLGTTTNMTAVPGTFANEAAVQTYLVTLRAEAEARLDAIEAKVDAVITALVAGGYMAAP